MANKLNLIVAACENGGIGKNGDLPWRLKKEMGYFNRMTTRVSKEGQKSAVVMGRKTWESIPSKFKPLKNRLNYVLTSNKDAVLPGAVVFNSLQQAIDDFSSKGDEVDTLWAIGGTSIYDVAMKNPSFHRAYITRIKAAYECDTFLPQIPESFVSVTDPDVPSEEQEEDGIKYNFTVLEKQQ